MAAGRLQGHRLGAALALSAALLALAGACTRAEQASAGATAPDQLSVSGGGARAMVLGLVFMDELDRRQLAYPRTCGLSGGAWAVLVQESVGAAPALAKIGAYLGQGNLLGDKFDGTTAATVGEMWATYAQWRNYVASVIVRPLAPFSFNEKGNAEVLIGTTATSPTGANVMDTCQTALFGPESRIVGLTNCAAHHQENVLQTRTVSTMKTGSRTPTGSFDLFRLNQAALTSTAYLDKREQWLGAGMPFQFPFEDVYGRKSSLWLELWDMGIKCNLAIAPARLNGPGVTLMVDASDDGATLFGSLETCKRFWQTAYGVSSSESSAPLSWNGRTLNVPNARRLYGPYVRRVDLHYGGKPTGHSLVVVTVGRFENGRLLGPERRLEGLGTIDWANRCPARFDKAAFDKMNVGVREFYSKVLDALLAPAQQQ